MWGHTLKRQGEEVHIQETRHLFVGKLFPVQPEQTEM